VGVTQWGAWWPVWHAYSLYFSLPHIVQHMLLPVVSLILGNSMAFRGEHAWAVLALGIISYEIACDEEELLSVAVDRWLLSHPLITRTAIVAVSLHLLNLLPWWADALGQRLWRDIFGAVKSRKVNVFS